MRLLGNFKDVTMKRQRGRNRNNNRNNNNNNPNRSLDSNGPGVKVRGNVSTIYEKYVALARDAQSSGNRVNAENLRQHAEHYLRVMNEMEAARAAAQAERDAQRAARGETDDNKEDGDERTSRRHNRNRKPREDKTAESKPAEDKAENDALEVVTPKAEEPKIKLKAKPSAKKAEVKLDGDAAEEKPKRRRKAPPRKEEAVDAAE